MTISRESLFRPTIVLSELLRKAYGDSLAERDQYSPFMFRALVIGVDPFGGRLENPQGIPEGPEIKHDLRDENNNVLTTYTIKTRIGPRNPMNSIKARILNIDNDEFVSDEDLRVYWPMWATENLPAPGEIVYTVFEDQEMTHGLWVGKVPHNITDERVNHVFINSHLRDSASSKSSLFPDSRQQKTDEVPVSRNLTNLFI